MLFYNLLDKIIPNNINNTDELNNLNVVLLIESYLSEIEV